MKSRIQIDIDEDNQPIITVDYQPSEDVRDKMVKKFLETFQHTSSWTTFHYDTYNDFHDNGSFGENGRAFAKIRPIPPGKLKEVSDVMAEHFSINDKVMIKNQISH